MPVYFYQGESSTRKLARGTITADTPRQARDLLRGRGITVRKLADQAIKSQKPSWFSFGSRSLQTQWTGACQELAMLLHAGITLLDALDTLAKQQTGSFRVVLLEIRDQVAAGASFAEALSQRPDVFDTATIHLVEVGENAGNLENVLEHLANFRLRLAETKDEVVTTLIYPAFLIVFGLGASIFLMTSVMPPLLESLQENLPELPWPTRVVQAVSNFLVRYGVIALIAAVALGLLFLGYIRSGQGQLHWHRFLLRIPIFGTMMVKQGVARIAMIVSTLLRSGIVLTSAFDLAAKSTNNRVLRDALVECGKRMGAGENVAEALERSGAFPPLAVRVFAVGQEQPWEYDPYRIRVWLSVDPSIPLDDRSKEQLRTHIRSELDIVFGAAAEIDAQTTPRSLFSSVLRELDQFAIASILENEFVLVLGRNHPATKEIRTLETALSTVEALHASPSSIDELRREIPAYTEDPTWKSVLDKLKPGAETHQAFTEQLKEGQIAAAFIRRSELDSYGRNVRYVPMRFPWQLDSLLKSHDKIFAVSLKQELDLYRIEVREIDARLRIVGPMMVTDSPIWESVPRAIAFAAQQGFTPMARIEQADTKLAQLRLRAGGLVTEAGHPASFLPGDVLQAFVRRDDRNGIPTLLQSIPWTFVAITKSNGIEAESAIFSGVRSALAGRKNRRTQKLCLRVRPVHDATDLRLGVMRDANANFAGAEVYRRTPGTEDLALVGRADWRGIANLSEKNLPLATYEFPSASPPADAQAANSTSPVKPPAMEKAQIQLRAPLYVYYVKNGNTLLARLPIVTGSAPLEQVELPDDRRRLESEAFVKGIQGEILDVVARRQLIAARIKKAVEDKNSSEAKKLLEELRGEKGYDNMSESLNTIQRRILSADRGPITLGTQKRIDQMFDLTRQMIQRYLQDSLLRDMEVAVGGL